MQVRKKYEICTKVFLKDTDIISVSKKCNIIISNVAFFIYRNLDTSFESKTLRGMYHYEKQKNIKKNE